MSYPLPGHQGVLIWVGCGRLDNRMENSVPENESITDVLNEMIRDGCPLNRIAYLAYMYGPPEEWPKDVDAALPGVFKTVSEDDRVGAVKGSA